MNGLFRACLAVMLAVTLAGLSGAVAWAQSDYRVRAGDLLAIEVLEDTTLNREVLVLPDGRFSFPYAGTVRAGGLTVDQIQAAIRSAIAPNFAVEPTVFVSVRQIPPPPEPTERVPVTIDVYFLGEFAEPGLRPVKPGTTFLQALAQGGAFTSFAALKRVQLRRTMADGTQSVTTINYRAIANGGSLSRDIVLQEGDVILVPERRLFE